MSLLPRGRFRGTAGELVCRLPGGRRELPPLPSILVAADGAVPEEEVADDITEVVFENELVGRAYSDAHAADLFYFTQPRRWSGGVETGRG